MQKRNKILKKQTRKSKVKKYADLTKEELRAEYELLKNKYEEYKMRNLSLDLSRGKPNSDQLDVSQGLMNVEMDKESCKSLNGVDCRNYGILDGLPEMKKFYADVLGLDPDYVTIGGNSSLQLMYDTLTRAMLFGVVGSLKPWCQEQGLKWICVVPGYDRHFKITEVLGFELLSVRMTESGPDMDAVEELVKDPKVKGIWCVPKYSNPTGNTYSDETVRRLASMKCAAPDFRIMWDNAYAVHDFNENGDKLLNIFDEAKKYGNEDRIFYFSSTSKITFPGGGVSLFAASPKNLKQISPYLGAQTIGYDKINQLRHLKYFKNKDNLHAHMMELAKLIGKKFDIVLAGLDSLSGLGVAQWTKPNGGYFISLDVMPGTAKMVFEYMKGAGVVLTPVGATFPYGKDPEDKNLRIAPTYPTDADLKLAVEILVLSVKLAAAQKLLCEKKFIH